MPATAGSAPSVEEKILFQQYFKSVGPRTYVSQVKRSKNQNHYIVLTEAKRDAKTKELRKTKLFIFSEDFEALFKLINETAAFVKAHPVDPAIRNRQRQHWAKAKQQTRAARA